MLAQLRISNFALIEDLDVSFYDSFQVLIGQTGAGKSLIVEALGLLLGKRADLSKVRDEKKKAVVEGTFTLKEDFLKAHPDLGEYLEDGSLTVSRVLLPSKSAVSRINGETVSLSVVREVMGQVLDIHSQFDSSLLYDKKSYLPLLDSFGKSDKALLKAKDGYSKAYSDYLKLKKQKEEFVSNNDLSRKDFLEYQVNEIESKHLGENEIENLEEELSSLENYENLENAYQEFSKVLSETDFSESLSGLDRTLNLFNGTVLEKEAQSLKEKLLDAQDALSELDEKYGDLDFSPDRIEAINERLFDLKDLQHKYGKTTSEILDYLKKSKEKLENLSHFDEEKERLEKEEKAKFDEVMTHASALNKERNRLAEGLSEKVNAELNDLGLKEGGFKVAMMDRKPDQNGSDDVSFLICMNKGGNYLPLKDAASGGEASRLSLALKAVFNHLLPYDTLVFDEIDTGISGNVATKAGKKLSQIAKDSSVIAITHLPQVAALADHFFYVYKETEGENTVSHLKEIEGEEVVEKIASLLSGEEVTKEALSAAKALLKQNKK